MLKSGSKSWKMTENASNSFSRKNEKMLVFPKNAKKNASIIEKGLSVTNVTPFQSHMTYAVHEMRSEWKRRQTFRFLSYLSYDHTKRQVIPRSRRIPKQQQIKNGAILLLPHLAAFSWRGFSVRDCTVEPYKNVCWTLVLYLPIIDYHCINFESIRKTGTKSFSGVG